VTGQRMVRGARRALSIAFAVLAVTVVAVGLAARLAPVVGFELFSIRSGSMEPTLSVGSLAIVATQHEPVDVGDPVAFRLPSGTVITHRVVGVVEADGGRLLRTQGDANEDPDPSLVPADSVVGTVAFSLPLLGFLLAMLGMPIGVVAIISAAGTMLTMIWLLEELESLDEADDVAASLAAPRGSRS
jgi:signal peptidase